MNNNQLIQFFIHKKSHQMKYAECLVEGMRRHGFLNIKISNDIDDRNPPDLAITWAHKKTALFNYQKKRARPYLIMERAYVGDRHNWVSLGYNGLNGRANFYNSNITSLDRWNKHFPNIVKSWKINENGPIVVIGQVPGDTAHSHINIDSWYKKTIEELLSKYKDNKIIFRNHPLSANKIFQFVDNKRVFYDTNTSLEETLLNAKACVTFSSNSAVISALNGIPTVAVDEGSMAYSVSKQTLDSIGTYTPNRDMWCAKLAWTQWLPEEIRSGEAWEHLKQGLV